MAEEERSPKRRLLSVHSGIECNDSDSRNPSQTPITFSRLSPDVVCEILDFHLLLFVSKDSEFVCWGRFCRDPLRFPWFLFRSLHVTPADLSRFILNPKGVRSLFVDSMSEDANIQNAEENREFLMSYRLPIPSCLPNLGRLSVSDRRSILPLVHMLAEEGSGHHRRFPALTYLSLNDAPVSVTDERFPSILSDEVAATVGKIVPDRLQRLRTLRSDLVPLQLANTEVLTEFRSMCFVVSRENISVLRMFNELKILALTLVLESEEPMYENLFRRKVNVELPSLWSLEVEFPSDDETHKTVTQVLSWRLPSLRSLRIAAHSENQMRHFFDDQVACSAFCDQIEVLRFENRRTDDAILTLFPDGNDEDSSYTFPALKTVGFLGVYGIFAFLERSTCTSLENIGCQHELFLEAISCPKLREVDGDLSAEFFANSYPTLEKLRIRSVAVNDPFFPTFPSEEQFPSLARFEVFVDLDGFRPDGVFFVNEVIGFMPHLEFLKLDLHANPSTVTAINLDKLSSTRMPTLRLRSLGMLSWPLDSHCLDLDYPCLETLLLVDCGNFMTASGSGSFPVLEHATFWQPHIRDDFFQHTKMPKLETLICAGNMGIRGVGWLPMPSLSRMELLVVDDQFVDSLFHFDGTVAPFPSLKELKLRGQFENSKTTNWGFGEALKLKELETDKDWLIELVKEAIPTCRVHLLAPEDNAVVVEEEEDDDVGGAGFCVVM